MEKPSIIGFIGDGQLAAMSAQKANELGFECQFFGAHSDGPCQDLGRFFHGEYHELDKLLEFAKTCDVITLENEFVSSNHLSWLYKNSLTPIYPSANCFSLIEDKLIEKNTFKQAGLDVCPFKEIKNSLDLEDFAKLYDFPFMLKVAKGGYDGYGTQKVNNLEQAQDVFNQFQRSKNTLVIAEQMVPFIKEVAITIVRSINGEIKVYPVVDTIQEKQICHYVIAPAQINSLVEEKIIEQSIKAMESIDAIGVFSFEFFVLKNDQVLLNESAPRPHNSAHYTMDACLGSQFENHMRSITGLKLADTSLITPQTVMLNILGTQKGPADFSGVDTNQSGVHIHLYGKKQSRIGRKMGHINLTGQNREGLLDLAQSLSNKIRI